MTEDTTTPAPSEPVAGPLEPSVGRPVDEATDAEGPRGTYGCACLDRDSVQCAAIRYGMDHYGEPCTCMCHQWSDDDDEYH